MCNIPLPHHRLSAILRASLEPYQKGIQLRFDGEGDPTVDDLDIYILRSLSRRLTSCCCRRTSKIRRRERIYLQVNNAGIRSNEMDVDDNDEQAAYLEIRTEMHPPSCLIHQGSCLFFSWRSMWPSVCRPTPRSHRPEAPSDAANGVGKLL